MAKNGETKERFDDKRYRRVIKDLREVERSTVDVGFFKTIARSGAELVDSDALDIAEIAAVNEFGSTKANIPERSFMRTTVDEKRIKYKKVLSDLMGDILIGVKTVNNALDLFGIRVVGDIKRKITSIRVPPNAPSTIAQKPGGNNPLIDTGRMRNAVTHKVKD